MSLSNTAVPKYYGKFRDAVIRGEIPVCEEISCEMNRIDDLIANPGIYYDPDIVDGWVRFCEKEMTLTDGSDFKMLDSFKLWGEQIWGWWYFVTRSIYVEDDAGGHYETRSIKMRLVTTQYLIVARSAAKTLYLAFIQAYGLIVDGVSTRQVTVAPTMDQADFVLQPIRTAIARAKGPLMKFMTEGSLQNTTGDRTKRQKLAPTKKGIQNFVTESILFIRPLAIDKLQGLNIKYATMDEWLSCDIKEDPINALEQGAQKNGIGNYVIVAASSEGTIRNRVGDSIKMYLTKILRGEVQNPHCSIFWYKLDDIREVADERMWKKANPNLGLTCDYEAYHLDRQLMESNPSLRNDILAKRFGIPAEGYTYFFTYEETLPHRYREYWSMACSLGADLSQGDDFCAFTFLFPLQNGTFGIKTRSYITERTLQKTSPAMYNKYQEFINEGSLIVMDGTILDVSGAVYDDLEKFIRANNYAVQCFGFDPYNAKDFVNRWELEFTPFGIVKVPQGARTESVPLGELKKLATDRALLFDESLMTFAMGNAIVLEDTNGNRKLLKKRHEDKIDNVAAMMDAFVAYKLNKEAFD